MFLALLATTALAYEHAGYAWTSDDMPIAYTVADDGTGLNCEESVPLGYCFTAIADAFTAWRRISRLCGVLLADGVGEQRSGDSWPVRSTPAATAT